MTADEARVRTAAALLAAEERGMEAALKRLPSALEQIGAMADRRDRWTTIEHVSGGGAPQALVRLLMDRGFKAFVRDVVNVEVSW